MKKKLLALSSAIVLTLALTACGQQPATAEPTPTDEPTATATEAPATPTAMPTATNTPAPTNTPTLAPTNTPTPTPAPDKKAYTLVSDKLFLYESWAGNDSYVKGPACSLYIRDVVNNDVATKELAVWKEDELIWTSTEPVNSFWLTETENGTEFLLVSLEVKNSKVTAHFELCQISAFKLGDTYAPVELIDSDKMSTEFYLATDGKTPVNASLSALDINNYIAGLQKYLANAELVYSSTVKDNDANVSELYSFLQDKKDMTADKAKLDTALKAIAENMPTDTSLTIPAANTTQNALITGRYTGYYEHYDSNDRNLVADLVVQQNSDGYYVDLGLERLTKLTLTEAKCENGVLEGFVENYPEIKMKLVFTDNLVHIELSGNENSALLKDLVPMDLEKN